MPFFEKLSRGERLRRQEDKLKRREQELIDQKKQTEEELDHRRRLDAYERKMKERELAEDREKLRQKQELTRERELIRIEEEQKKNAKFQATLVAKKDEELRRTKREYDDRIRDLEMQAANKNQAALQKLEDEKILRQRTQMQLQRERDEQQKEYLAREAKKQAAEHKRRELQLKMQREEKLLEERRLREEKKRQKEELENRNSSKALQELRELIRARYELDNEIWRRRNHAISNRDLVEKRMVESDEVLQNILSRIEHWNDSPDCGFDEAEWELANDVKERLLEHGKRIWALDPPWPKVAKGQKPVGRGPPSGTLKKK
jgi:trichohyalin